MEQLIDREHIRIAFKKYTVDYDLSDPKIKLKYDHTFRVADLCDKIAIDLDLSSFQRDIAWTAGMLHDIGRFEQVRRYGTFEDAKSIDHAQFGADLLFLEGLFADYIKLPVTDDSKDMQLYQMVRRYIEIAIRNHNKFLVDDGLTDEEQVFCDILRDADKIDILKVNCETPLEDIYNVSTEELRTASVTEVVKEEFKKRNTILRAYKKSPVDHVVGHVSLVFGLVYPISKKLLREQGFLEILLHFESQNEQTKEWFQYMQEHIWDEL